jgi:hypothetical protein
MTGHVGDALCGACVWETLGILRAAASARQVLTRGEFVRDRSTG